MRRIILILAAVIGLLSFGMAPASADTLYQQVQSIPVENVTYAQIAQITNSPSACAVVDPGVAYTVPLTDVVSFAVSYTVGRAGYHSDSGYALVGSGAYPGKVLVANWSAPGVYPAHQYVVFVPGLNGNGSCDQWIEYVAQG